MADNHEQRVNLLVKIFVVMHNVAYNSQRVQYNM